MAINTDRLLYKNLGDANSGTDWAGQKMAHIRSTTVPQSSRFRCFRTITNREARSLLCSMDYEIESADDLQEPAAAMVLLESASNILSATSINCAVMTFSLKNAKISVIDKGNFSMYIWLNIVSSIP